MATPQIDQIKAAYASLTVAQRRAAKTAANLPRPTLDAVLNARPDQQAAWLAVITPKAS